VAAGDYLVVKASALTTSGNAMDVDFRVTT
jgi:hypothetical protein